MSFKIYDINSIDAVLDKMAELRRLCSAGGTNNNLEFTLENLRKTYLQVTAIFDDDTPIAFSGVRNSLSWPSHVARVFSNFSMNPDVNWNDPVFGRLAKITHDHQIDFCANNNYSIAFVSRQIIDNRQISTVADNREYLSAWTNIANQYSSEWKFIEDKLFFVGSLLNLHGIHVVTYKDLTHTPQRAFPLKSISMEDAEAYINALQ